MTGNLPPGPRVSGLVGLLLFMARPTASLDEQFRTHGDLYTVHNPLFGTQVMVSHPELIGQILGGDPDVFRGGEANQLLAPVIGKSVLAIDGVAHRRARKLLMPPFHGKRLAIYGDAMHAIARGVLDEWPRGKRFALLPSMQRITFEAIMRTVFGARDGDTLEPLRRRLTDLVERAQSPLGMLWMLPPLQRDLGPLTGWASLKRAIDAADAAIHGVIEAARDGAAARDDILAMLLSAVDDAGEPMSAREIRDELVTLLFAGHETTATALCWAVEEIARRPDVLARLLDEIDGAGATDAWRAELPYLDATLKEVLRLRPIVPLVARKLAAPVALGGYEIPAGAHVVPCIYNAQRHPDYWDEPSAFEPERFLGKKPNPYAWLPFGGGPHRCAGMAFALYEMRVVLATILSRMTLHVRGPLPAVALRSFTFAPKGSTPIVVHDRGLGARAAS